MTYIEELATIDQRTVKKKTKKTTTEKKKKINERFSLWLFLTGIFG